MPCPDIPNAAHAVTVLRRLQVTALTESPYARSYILVPKDEQAMEGLHDWHGFLKINHMSGVA